MNEHLREEAKRLKEEDPGASTDVIVGHLMCLHAHTYGDENPMSGDLMLDAARVGFRVTVEEINEQAARRLIATMRG